MDECQESIRLVREKFPRSDMLSEIVLLVTLKNQSSADAIEVLEVCIFLFDLFAKKLYLTLAIFRFPIS